MTRLVFLTTLVVAAFAAVATARPAPSTHTVHEKRSAVHSRWSNPLRIKSDFFIPVKIGLKQSNLHRGHDLLMDVSHPDSENYGKFWSEEEVTQMFAPSDESVTAVKHWLTTSGIHDIRITHSENKGWLAFVASGDELENLLHADFYEYEDSHTGDKAISSERYHVPKHLKEHIDYITPGIRFPFLKKRSPDGAFKVPLRSPAPADLTKSLAFNTTSCDEAITPGCIAAMYQIPQTSGTPSPNNSLGIYETADVYSQSDLNNFFATYPSYGIPNGTAPILDAIDGASITSGIVAGESNLDFSLAYPIVYPQNITLYQVDDTYYAEVGSGGGRFNTFLDALDGSYCTSCYAGECGDASIDPVYPDPIGYQGQLMCGIYTPTNVISLSYGAAEDTVPRSYYERQCNEFMKLGLRGVSVIFASGDSGVGASQGCLGNSSTIFNPGWPASCPYVTSVGATKIPAGGSIKTEVVANNPAGDPYTMAWASGGGFSNVFGIPDYQAEAIENYFANYNPSYPYYNGTVLGENGGLYNRSGRGYPDVSAIGDNIPIYVDGSLTISGGTSAAAPVFASIINRIIEERIAAGKPGPVGFLNPILYKNPVAFNDITNGTNSGCGTSGFSAVPGWDPASGLGTPSYPELRDVLMAV
ncbi:Aorsin [Talaromyces atroroseus]|uniref:tripeptidyl-peptidase II n=1 Tax=Talaromyces atroroseus TaxID=1441469 RepID=A0A225AQW5_TALAT|nr:Aorsin [Talaromyces atroroseus]OKL57999.1 Aorsin [Talaromyces atroroseus]